MQRRSPSKSTTWFIGVPTADPESPDHVPHYRIEVKVGNDPWEARYLSSNARQVEAIWKGFFFPGEARVRLLKDGVPIASKVLSC